MAWNTKLQKRTLFIRKNPGNGKYQIEQFVDVLTNEGVSYREPIPAETMGLRHMEFDAVEFITDRTPIKRDNTAGQHNLIGTNSNGLQSRSAPA